MEILKIIALILCPLIFLSSCVQTNERALDYQDYPFSAIISIEFDELSAVAELCSQPTESGLDMTLKFTSPDSLAGIELKDKNGKVTASLGELVFSEALSLNLAELFSVDGKINKISQAKIGAVNCNCLDIISNNGESYKVYISQDSTPLRIVRLGKNSLTVNILAFTSKR